jgi:hypothetical protein
MVIRGMFDSMSLVPLVSQSAGRNSPSFYQLGLSPRGLDPSCLVDFWVDIELLYISRRALSWYIHFLDDGRRLWRVARVSVRGDLVKLNSRLAAHIVERTHNSRSRAHNIFTRTQRSQVFRTETGWHGNLKESVLPFWLNLPACVVGVVSCRSEKIEADNLGCGIRFA